MGFFFPSRIARLSYFLRNLLLGVATWPLSLFLEEEASTPPSIYDLWLLLLAIAIIGYWLVYIVRPRCKDAGIRWGWMFLMLVPLVNVGFGAILLFYKGQPAIGEENA